MRLYNGKKSLKKYFKFILPVLSIFVTVNGLLILDRKLGSINTTGKQDDVVLPANQKVLMKTFEFTSMVHTSTQGLRDRYFDRQKPDNTLRILALGDSFTY